MDNNIQQALNYAKGCAAYLSVIIELAAIESTPVLRELIDKASQTNQAAINVLERKTDQTKFYA